MHLDKNQTPSILKTLISLSAPVMAGQIFSLLYTMVDTYFIAQLDPSDPWLVGSTGVVFPLYFIFMAVTFGISGGISSLVARAIGAGKSEELNRTAESGLAIGLIVSVSLLLLLYPLASPLLQIFGASGQMLVYALTYVQWLLPMLPFMFLSAVFTGILQGEGRTKHLMFSMILGTLINIVLDPLLMFTAGMGIAGAGLATALGNAAGFFYLLVVFIRSQSKVKIHWKIEHISFAVMAEILRVGLPQSIMNFLASVSFIFYNRMMSDVDPRILTSFTLYSRLEQIALVPIWSLLSGLGTMVGMAAGAHDFARIRETQKQTNLLGMGVGGTLLLVYVFASPLLFRFFQTDVRVLELAGVITPWMAATTFLAIPIIIMTTVFSAAGFANRSLSFSIIRIYGLNVPAAALGAYVIGKNLNAVMFGLAASAILTLILGFYLNANFHKGLVSGRLQVKVSVSEQNKA